MHSLTHRGRLGHIRSPYSLWYCVPLLVIFLVFFLLPALANFYLAFTDWSMYHLMSFPFSGLANLREVFSSKMFWPLMKNTFYFAIVTVVLKNLLGFILAVFLDNQLRATKFYRSVFFMPCILSSMIVCLIWRSIYSPQDGLLNSFLTAIGQQKSCTEWLFNIKTAMNAVCSIEIWQWSGFHMTIYLAALQSISPDYFEAAAIDGASRWQQFTRIKVPLMIGSFTVNIVLAVVGGLRVFDKVYATTNGGPNDATQVFTLYIYQTFGQGRLGLSSAYNLVFTVIVVLLSVILLKIFGKLGENKQ